MMYYVLIIVGGVFLATGSSDYVIRVFSFTALIPEKICELEAHTVSALFVFSVFSF